MTPKLVSAARQKRDSLLPLTGIGWAVLGVLLILAFSAIYGSALTLQTDMQVHGELK